MSFIWRKSQRPSLCQEFRVDFLGHGLQMFALLLPFSLVRTFLVEWGPADSWTLGLAGPSLLPLLFPIAQDSSQGGLRPGRNQTGALAG